MPTLRSRQTDPINPGAEVGHIAPLLRARALQSAIFNSAHFSSIATDAAGVIQIFNVGAERMLGYEAADLVNQNTPADISDPQEIVVRATALSQGFGTPIAPGFEALVFKASRTIEDIYELTYIRKDGSRLPAVVSVTALRDEAETIIGYLLIGTDNTARKKVEDERMRLDQRLRDQHFYTRSLIESNIDALMTTDPRGIITDVNKQTEALTGCTRDELIGAPFRDYFTDPNHAELGIKRVLTEGKVTNYELTARARDGKLTVVSYNATTFHDRDRRLQGVFAAARDVTELKRIERALQQKNAELEDASRMKSEFLANMSHELRTPLNAIIGFSEVLIAKLFGELNEKQEDYLQDIHTSGKHLLNLINDVLDLSKVEAGRMDLEPSQFDLPSALSDAMTLIRERATKHGIQLGLDVEPELGPITADERKFKQILLNLLSNAVKFTPDGGRVDVKASRTQDAVEIAVRDTGIGIAPGDQEAVFEEFRQVGADYMSKQEGTGLGLALTRRFVELHGGRIWLTSEVGKGSTFYFTIPDESAGGKSTS